MRALADDGYEQERRLMLERIDELVAATANETGIAALSPGISEALLQVPRHEFVPPAGLEASYANRPLPIGHRQTISQPYIVALMTELLRPKATDRVLEIGTGSGYQAAVLSKLVDHVYSVEIVPGLGREAAQRLASLGCDNVHLRIGDGYAGWPEAAPFDAIIVTAAPDHLPPALVEQLRTGGRMVIPVGGSEQELMVVAKTADGRATSQTVIPVRFVPLTRQ